jgi:hypothetical protein
MPVIAGEKKMADSLRSLLLLMATLVALVCMSIAQDDKPEFSIAISAPPSVKTGSFVAVNITLTNISDHDIKLDDDAHGERNFDLDVRDSQGTPPPETLYLKASRGESQGAGPSALVLTQKYIIRDLKPGKTTKEEAWLSQVFDLKPGMYTVTFRRADYHFTPHDVMRTLTEQEGQPYRGTPPPLKPKAIVKSNTITITVTP